MSPKSRKALRIGMWILLIAFLVSVPYLLHRHVPRSAADWMNILVLAAGYGIAALGLNIIVGYCGLLNLGFGGFMLIGAYTTGILMKEYHWSFWFAALAAIAHGTFWGIVLGLPTLRLTGDYFAIVTFGLSELVNMIARNWTNITRGTAGYPNVPRPGFGIGWLHHFGLLPSPEKLDWLRPIGLAPKMAKGNLPGSTRLDFTIAPNANAYWFLSLALLGLCALFCARLLRSRLGRAWRALREDEVAAEACGINAMWYKTIAFAMSAGLGALAGSFLATYRTHVDYRSFDFMTSVFVLCYIVLGGMGTVLGPIIGSLVLVSLSEILRDNPFEYLAGMMKWWPAAHDTLERIPWVPDLRMILFGIILIIMIRFRPEGLFPSKSRRHELHSDANREKETALFDLRSQE